MNLFFNFKKAISAFAIVAFFTIIPTEFTWAHHTNNWGYVSMGTNDYVYNYDFDSKSLSADNLDWPVTIIFENNAEIDKVKRDLTPYGFGEGGSTQWGRVSDYLVSNLEWDGDSGRDENACPIHAHYRIYAPPDDKLGYNQTYGYFVIATTHQDRNHYGNCPGKDKFGWSETASNQVRVAAVNAYGQSNVRSNVVQMYNAISTNHWSHEGTRYWQNDGLAHLISVP